MDPTTLLDSNGDIVGMDLLGGMNLPKDFTGSDLLTGKEKLSAPLDGEEGIGQGEMSEMRKRELSGSLEEEPLLKENPNRFVIFPIQDAEVSRFTCVSAPVAVEEEEEEEEEEPAL
jgi:hypothetical protein